MKRVVRKMYSTEYFTYDLTEGMDPTTAEKARDIARTIDWMFVLMSASHRHRLDLNGNILTSLPGRQWIVVLFPMSPDPTLPHDPEKEITLRAFDRACSEVRDELLRYIEECEVAEETIYIPETVLVLRQKQD